MGNDDRCRHALEQFFEQLDTGNIEMVGRLVEQQQIGLQRKGERQCRPLAFAARSGRRISGFVQTEALQIFGQPGLHPPALALVVKGLELAALEQTLVQCLGHRQDRLLLDRADLQTVATLHQPVVKRQSTGNDRQQRGLAGAIAPDKADPFAREQGKSR